MASGGCGGSAPKGCTLGCSSPARRKGTILSDDGGRRSRHHLLVDFVAGFIQRYCLNSPQTNAVSKARQASCHVWVTAAHHRSATSGRKHALRHFGMYATTQGRENPKRGDWTLPWGYLAGAPGSSQPAVLRRGWPPSADRSSATRGHFSPRAGFHWRGAMVVTWTWPWCSRSYRQGRCPGLRPQLRSHKHTPGWIQQAEGLGVLRNSCRRRLAARSPPAHGTARPSTFGPRPDGNF